MDNPPISKNSKTSSGETSANHPSPGTGKPDPQPKHSTASNAHVQSHPTADENAIMKMQLETNPQEAIKEMERRVQILMSEKEELRANKEQLLREKREAEKHIHDLQGRTQKLEEELKTAKRTFRGARDKHLDTEKLLEERTADLKVAQTFLTTDDRYAGAEIMKMVEVLNDEIFQGAALISELLGDGVAISKVDQRRKITRDDSYHLTGIVGRELIEHLSTKSEQVQVNPLPLQLAVQAILTHWCVYMANIFYEGPGKDDLKRIYTRIWESEPQAVAGRWRAMTVGQAKHLETSITKDPVIKMLSNVLYLCGNPRTNVASQKINLCLDRVASTIMDMWMQLKTAIHEGVTTTEMQVFRVEWNEKYRDAAMNDIYADTEYVQERDSGKGPGCILCTVGMGLKRSVISRNRDGMPIPNDIILLKAKVAFPSVLFNST